MLRIKVKGREFYDEKTNEFIYSKDTILQLEHSLVSISKWESKWKKSFLNSKEKSPAEFLDYIRCMCITQNVSEDVFRSLDKDNFTTIQEYMNDTMTATVLPPSAQKSKGGSRDVITSELIYYWMVSLQIPFECQRWHLNRLLTLIDICNIKNTPPKKMSTSEILNRNKALNAARRAKYHSAG